LGQKNPVHGEDFPIVRKRGESKPGAPDVDCTHWGLRTSHRIEERTGLLDWIIQGTADDHTRGANPESSLCMPRFRISTFCEHRRIKLGELAKQLEVRSVLVR
jgi:hypothetical protein